MPKLENFSNRIEIDSVPFPKNELKGVAVGTDKVSVVFNHSSDNRDSSLSDYYQLIYSDWTDSGDTPYASQVDLLSDMKDFFFSVASGGGGGTSDDITNASNVSGVTVTDALDDLDSRELDNIIKVNQGNVATTLGGIIDSSKEYFIDGLVDMGTTQITVPPTGITLRGYSFDISGLISSEDNYTMFISESIAIGSGNLLGIDYYISVTGASSKVYEIYDATGFNAFEFTRVNYNDCTSLGDIYDYRQGLEIGTGRFGGSPSLTLHGVWVGGFRITTSIVRSLSAAMTEPIFKEGLLFQMNSRFLTDINIDLPALAPLLDFQPVNFPNPSTLQLQGCQVTRDGVIDADGANITPNISSSDLSSYWKGNNGLNNTHVGGSSTITTEIQTTINTINVYEDLLGTYTPSDLQHFDSPSNGQLRHIGNNPRDYKVTAGIDIDGGSNDELQVSIQKWDDSASIFIEVASQLRVVNNFQGGRDVAFFNVVANTTLDQNDFIKIQVRNTSDTSNVTSELDSYFIIEER